MYRAVVVSLVLLVVSGLAARLDAKMIPYRKLTPGQRMELEASELRLARFDRQLQALDRARRHGKISRTEYAYEAHDLTAYIMAEARFQNDILVDSRPFPSEEAREVIGNVFKYGVVYPAAAIAYLAVRVAPGFSGVSP